MNILYICLAITIAISFIWDYSPFINDILKAIGNYLKKPVKFKKPFGCSFCMTFWITLIVILVFNYKICFLSICFAWFSQHCLTIFNTIDMVVNMVLGNLQKLIEFIRWK